MVPRYRLEAPPCSTVQVYPSLLRASLSSASAWRRAARPDHVHHIDTYRLSCTCEAGRWGKRCWALAAALQYEAYRRHELAKAQATAERTWPAGMAALQEAFG